MWLDDDMKWATNTEFIIGASLSEPHSLVAHRAQAQCIMVRSLRSFVRTLYVRTRNFFYSDLNPTGFSPRTGYFENFQSLYNDLQ
jgi:hypothetical protein